MADIAQVGFSADTSELKAAKASLDALVPSAANVDKSTEKLAKTFDKLDGIADKLAAAAAGLSSAGDKLNSVLNRQATAADNASKGVDKVVASINYAATASQGLISKATNVNVTFGQLATAANGASVAVANASVGLQDFNSHVIAYRNNLASAAKGGEDFNAHILAYRQHLDQTAKQIKFTGMEGLNLSRQLADIGVTAAMGMNPFMIALQQGPQLFDILQQKAVMTGATVTSVARAAGAAIWTAVAPILPILALIAAGIALIAGGFALATREINKGSESIVAGLGLTEKQLERVKKSGVETGVTIGDTFFAFFEVVGDRLASAFDGPLKWLRDLWKMTLDFILKIGEFTIKSIIGGFTGAVYAIKASWSLLPGALGDLAIQSANLVISSVEWMINKSIAGLNVIIGFANAAAAKVGLAGFDLMGDVSIGRVNNPFAGQANAARQAIATGFKQGMADASGAVDRFFGDVGKAARNRAKNRILEAAGAPEKGNKNDGAAKGKTDAEKFDDIMKNADARIATLKAERDAIGLGTEAMARMRFEQDLLNEAAQKGIPITEKELTLIKAKAAEYGKLTAEIERMKFMQGVDEKIANDQATLEQQRQELSLSGEALVAYRYEQELLNQAKAKHIELTQQEKERIHEASIEYAASAESIRKQREALEFQRETARGFFRDLYDNMKNGQNILDAFANAFSRMVDKIIDKIVDSAIDKFVNDLITSISAGGFAKGGAFGTGRYGRAAVGEFAKGGAFTNEIVSNPTMFAFANGGALGVMGEAGPEAIMPLKRGNDGSLGVQLHGSKGGGSAAINVSVVNHHTITGAVSSEDVINLNKQSAEQTKNELRRDIPNIIQQYQRDGALS